MRVLGVDIGGTNVEIIGTGQTEHRRFPSGPSRTPETMVAGVKEHSAGWDYDAVSIGYPGLVLHSRIVAEPHNIASSWVEFDFEAAFERPLKVLNDDAMQTLGSYRGGVMLFLGLGTGRGRRRGADGTGPPSVRERDLRTLPGRSRLKRLGKKKWRKHVAHGVGRLATALHPDDVVLGGGNAKKLKVLPEAYRAGGNAHAFTGGFRLWDSGIAGPDRP